MKSARQVDSALRMKSTASWRNSGCDLSASSKLQRCADAVERKHAKDVPDCNARFT